MSFLRRWYVAPFVAIAFAGGMTWCSLALADALIWHGEPPVMALYLTARFALLGAAIAALLAGIVLGVTAPARPRWFGQLLAAVCAAGTTILLLEALFTFVARSHGVGYSMAGRIWHERHWSPVNELGYRDAAGPAPQGKRVLWALGDSFTAGHGIADVADRYPDRLAGARQDLHVVNLGHCGADTAEELRRLRAHPGRPDVLLLQHFPNDLDGAAQRAGRAMPPFTPYQDLRSTKLRFVVRGSYLANFVYWQFPRGDVAAYDAFVAATHEDDAVARAHEEELAAVHDWAKERGVPLFVLVLPLMEDLEWSRKANARVLRFFAERGVPTIDAAGFLGDLTVEQRVVNRHDTHASALVHERIAQELARRLPR
jgi:hypothetical protein